MKMPESRPALRRSLSHSRSRAIRGMVALSIGAAALAAPSAHAQDPLARLIPPDAAVLAGMHRAAYVPTDQLWLATPNNLHDLDEFVSVTVTDPARRFDEVIVADSPAGSDPLADHLLLARGRFHFDTLRHAPGLLLSSFEEVPVLVMPATSTSGPRWLAVLHDRLALYGSPAAVGRAIERARTSSPADPAIAARLRQASAGEVSWSSVTLDPAALREHLRLRPGQASIASCLADVRAITLGSAFTPAARVDLRVLTASPQQAAIASSCLTRIVDPNTASVLRVVASPQEAMVSISFSGTRETYTRWLASYRQPMVDQLLAAARPPSPSGAAAGQ
jgi:hypothetical protein